MAKAKTSKFKLDLMSVTVLLVMSIFGGIVGYYLGKGATSAQDVAFLQATTLMRDKGSMMQDAGKLMNDQGKRMGDRTMMDKGTQMMEGGSELMGQSTTMMGMMPQ